MEDEVFVVIGVADTTKMVQILNAAQRVPFYVLDYYRDRTITGRTTRNHEQSVRAALALVTNPA